MDSKEHQISKPHTGTEHHSGDRSEKKILEMGKGGIKVSKKLLFASLAVIGLALAAFAVFSFLPLVEKVEPIKSGSDQPQLNQIFDGLELIEVVKSSCADCFDISQLTSALKQLNLKIAGEKRIEFDSEEGKRLVQQYGVENVPNLIVIGDVSSN